MPESAMGTTQTTPTMATTQGLRSLGLKSSGATNQEVATTPLPTTASQYASGKPEWLISILTHQAPNADCSWRRVRPANIGAQPPTTAQRGWSTTQWLR